MKKKKIIQTGQDKVFSVIVYVVLIAVLLIVLYPMYFMLIASFSNAAETAAGRTYLFIRGFTTEAYIQVFKNDKIWIGYWNTLIITTIGTAWALFCTISCAYSMSRRDLRGSKLIMVLFVITMYFGGGIIPFAILIKNLGMYNSLWSLILPGGFSVYNMLIARSFFRQNFPDQLYEAAKVDGASELTIFIKIALPISGAIIAVIGLFNAVGFWNSYFNALLFITDYQKWPLQLVLRGILIQGNDLSIDMEHAGMMSLEQAQYQVQKQQLANTMRYAVIVIASLPMLIAYPFVQKYFVKGVLIGSIK